MLRNSNFETFKMVTNRYHIHLTISIAMLMIQDFVVWKGSPLLYDQLNERGKIRFQEYQLTKEDGRKGRSARIVRAQWVLWGRILFFLISINDSGGRIWICSSNPDMVLFIKLGYESSYMQSKNFKNVVIYDTLDGNFITISHKLVRWTKKLLKL